MKVVDIHPEELLDKDARGELTGDERVRLETHVARCAACRAEQLLRLDFADELDFGAGDRDSSILGLVQGALAAPRVVAAKAPEAPAAVSPPREVAVTGGGAGQAPQPPQPPQESSDDAEIVPLVAAGLPRKRPRRTAVVLLVAAAVMAASAAGATGLTGRVWLSLRGSQEVTHSTAAPMGTATTGTVGTVAAPNARPAPAPEPVSSVSELAPPAPPAPEDAPEEMMGASAAPAPPVGFMPVRAAGPALPSVPAYAGPASVVGAGFPAPPVPAPASSALPTTASALFESANAARRAGDTGAALARYDALDRQFPGTREARVAKATSAKLLLDRGDAAGALDRFDAYLASGSAELREEAMAGRATALERLGRSDEEARAWTALLATYPGTPYAAHARARATRSSPR